MLQSTSDFISNLLFTSFTSVAIIGFLTYLLRKLFGAWLIKQTNIEVEKYKADLQNLSELLKFDIQKDAIRAEHHIGSLNTIYPELYSKLRIAQGHISSLFGLRYAPNWTGSSAADIEKLLIEKNAPSLTRDDIVQEVTVNRPNGLKKLEEYLRDHEFYSAHMKLSDVMNFIILKEIFISKDIRELSLEIHKLLVSAKVNGEMMISDPKNTGGNWYDLRKQDLNSVDQKIDILRDKIHKELSPSR